MNKQKGKEKMANILSEPYYEKETDTLSGWEEEYCDKKTESLYNAGYRKGYDKITSKTVGGVETSIIVPCGELAKAIEEKKNLELELADLANSKLKKDNEVIGECIAIATDKLEQELLEANELCEERRKIIEELSLEYKKLEKLLANYQKAEPCICGICKKPLFSNDKYCPHCGAKQQKLDKEQK